MNIEKVISTETYLSWVKKANEATTAYYDYDSPIMTDIEFDELMQKIKNFEFTHGYISPDSPTQRVGGSVGKSTFAKVLHEVPMLSLQDVFNIYDVVSFAKDCDYGKNIMFSVEEKIDGLSMQVTYEDGVLVRAETRGDGYTGEDITENAKYVLGIPKTLPLTDKTGTIKKLVVRTEVYMDIATFESLNNKRELEGKKLFANPRNAAAGLLRSHDISVLEGKILKAFVFDMQKLEFDYKNYGTIYNSDTHVAAMILLSSLGFKVVPHHYVFGAKSIPTAIETIGERKNDLPYWIDGAVVKVVDYALREDLGTTNKVPKWAVAYKFPADEKETVIRDIILQTGRTGRVTPVAVFDPVQLGGTTVTRATLHNPEQIKKLKVNVGDTVLVRKAAEIIPEVVRVTHMSNENSDIYDVFAHKCPSCGSTIVPGADENGKEESGAYCTNPDCPAQLARRFEFWGSRDCMDITGFGPAYIDRFISLGWLKTIPDIYRLKEHREEMINLDGFGEKATDKLLEAIEQSKTRNIDRLLKALSIPGVGRHIGKTLAENQPGFYAIMTLPYNALRQYEGVGEISAKVMVEYFSRPDFHDMMVELANLGVNVKSLTYKSTEDKAKLSLSGKTFVITGTLPTMKREEASKLIEDNGGKVSSSVSKKTDYLLAGDKAGSKLDKATALGIKIISEDELYKMI